MDRTGPDPRIHEGLTQLQELRWSMLQAVLRVLAVVVAVPVGLFLAVNIARFFFYATDLLRGVGN